MRNALIPRETNVAEVLEHHLQPLIESLLYPHVIFRNNCNNLTVHMTHLNSKLNLRISSQDDDDTSGLKIDVYLFQRQDLKDH